MKLFKALFITLLALSAIACGPDRVRDEPVEDRSAGSSNQGSADNQEGDNSQVYVGSGSNNTSFNAQSLDDPQSPLSERVIYFEYDSSEIKPEYQEILLAHGEFLAQNPNFSVLIEGHTDERGTREYNIGLGERRAQSVLRILMLSGISESQAETLSYGEEKLVDFGSNDQAHSKNRRAVLVYKEQ